MREPDGSTDTAPSVCKSRLLVFCGIELSDSKLLLSILVFGGNPADDIFMSNYSDIASFAASDASLEFFFDWTPDDFPSELISLMLAWSFTSSPL